MDALTLGDFEDFEDYTGVALGEAVKQWAPAHDGDDVNVPARHLTALVWILTRIDDPGFTVEQARRMPLTGLTIEVASNPPEPAGG